MDTKECDVLIIGSGAAGLRCAIELRKLGIDVVVVGKCRRGDAHTVLATGGINAALKTIDKKDSWLIHAADTLSEGRFLADYRMVSLLCRNAPHAIKDLMGYGVRFARDKDGKLIQRFFGAHTYRRTCFVGDETGKAILRALVKEVRKRKIPFMGEVYILTLLTADGYVNGALGFDIKKKALVAFNSKAVVLATGGHSRLYRRSSSRIYENTGDGIALAYDAGAELQDMEMLQFHPTGMVWPKNMEGTLVTEAVRGEGGVLMNSKKERFMKSYHPRMELGPRDVVARAIYNEIANGHGTRHGGVWLDITHKPKNYILKRLPKIYSQFKSIGIDISRERMEVAPTAHYSMGGIRVNGISRTAVPGLFAIGEVTGGLHGANRLGGNSLAETIVFGRLSGKEIADYCKRNKIKNIQAFHSVYYTGLFHRKGGTEPAQLRRELQSLMWNSVGLIRDKKDLAGALNKLSRLKKAFEKVNINGDIDNFIVALDVRNLFVAAEAVIRSALLRKESRGAHYRKDYPKENKKWLVNIICKKSNKGMKMYTAKVPATQGRLKKALKKLGKRAYGFAE